MPVSCIFEIRFVLDSLSALFIYVTPYFKYLKSDDGYPLYYYIIYATVRTAHLSNDTAIGRSIDAFYAQITDVRIAATYMTLLSTMMSLCSLYFCIYFTHFISIMITVICYFLPRLHY